VRKEKFGKRQAYEFDLYQKGITADMKAHLAGERSFSGAQNHSGGEGQVITC